MTHLLHERVSRAVEPHGEATAIVSARQSMTYAEVGALSSRVAHALVEAGCRSGDRVGLLLAKSPETIAAMIGVLKAGCAYVPVDLASPASRAARILSRADVRVVLVDNATAALLDGVYEEGGISAPATIGTTGEPIDSRRFQTTFDATTISRFAETPPQVSVRSEDPAHILFTSGSTGEPKGVIVTHGNVSTFLDWALPAFDIRSTDRLSSHPPLHFDLSTFDVYGALTSGAALYLVEPQLNLSPHALARFIGESALTQWFSVPSVMTFLASFDAVPNGGWPALERVLFCGEVLPTPVLRHWMDCVPHATFTNLYGPTEATIASSYHTFSTPPVDDSSPIPIGIACEGEELLVLDSELEPVPQDEVGELYIGGVGLSPGYWRDEEKTGSSFVPDPRDSAGRLYRTGDLARVGKDGLLYFVGRVDSQIKSRGYRIELGEIEAALNAVESVRECGVVAIASTGFEGTQIGCAYSLTSSSQATSLDLRAQAAHSLPRYMLPTRWLQLSELPKNMNGKIDRPRIRELLVEISETGTHAGGA